MAIVTELNCNLREAVKVQYLDGNLFSQDVYGNVIRVVVMDGDTPATLSGTVSGTAIRADGGTVPITDGWVDGNVAAVSLSAAAYAVPGVISITIKISDTSTVTTLASFVTNVYRTSTDTVVDPGTIIPSIQTLITAIETAVASIPADYSALWTSLAPAFDANKSGGYAVGEYCTYDGGVYKFKNAHTGSWSSSDVDAVNLGAGITKNANDIIDLKSALNDTDTAFFPVEEAVAILGNSVTLTKLGQYFIKSDGGIASSASWRLYGLEVEPGKVYDLSTYFNARGSGNTATFTYAVYNSNVTLSNYSTADLSANMVYHGKAYGGAEESLATAQWLNGIRAFVPVDGSVIIISSSESAPSDPTMKPYEYIQSETAVEAKDIADAISIIYFKNMLNPDTLTAASILNSDGTITTSPSFYSLYSVSDFIDVTGHTGEYIYNTTGNDESASNRSWMFLHGYVVYGADKETVVYDGTAFTGNNFVVPSGGYYVRICAQTSNMETKGMIYYGTGKEDYVAYSKTILPIDRERVVALENAVSQMYPKTAIVPPKIWGVVGSPFSVYYYNIMQIDDLENYHLYVTPVSSKVKDFGNRLWFACTETATYEISLTLRNNNNDIVLTVILNVEIVSNNIPSIKALFIGDSFIDTGYILAQLINKMGDSLTLYGTRGFENVQDLSGTARSGDDEGRYGWRLQQYWESESVGGVSNAFYDGTSFNMSYYMTQHPTFADATDVFILSGANDAGWGVTNYMTNMKKIVNNIKSYNESATNPLRIHLLIPVTCCVIGYGYGSRSNESGYEHRYRCIALANALINEYKNDNDVILTPIHVDLDPVNDFPTTTVAASDHNPTLVTVGNDNVHPSKYGYFGIASTIFGDIVANCQSN